MLLRGNKGQTSFEMIVIIGAIVLPIAYVLGGFFYEYIKLYSNNILRNNFQCQVRYGVGMGDDVNAGRLGSISNPALQYVSGSTSNRHPYARVAVNIQ